MITLHKLRWNNCFSYGANNELDLSIDTVTQIVGTNGKGKSSIPLIIEEVLFNKNSKGIKKADIPNRYINEGYSISLEWSKDSDDYLISVDRTKGIKVKLYKNNVDISSHTATNTYKTVQEILGLDFKTFTQLVYQNTNTSLQFLTATDTTRKKFLIDLLHLESYTKYFELFKEASKDANNEVLFINSKVKVIEKWLENNKLEDTTILPMLKLEIETEDDAKEAQRLLSSIENISEKNKKIIKNNQYKAQLKQIDKSTFQENSSIKKKSYDKEQSSLGSKKRVISEAKRLISKLEKLGDICPTCEQSVDNKFIETLISQERDKTQQAEKEIDQLTSIIKRIKRDNESYELRERTQRDWENLYRSIESSLPSTPLDEEQLRDRLGIVQGRLRDARTALERQAKENERRAQHNTRIEVILEQTDSFIAELNQYKEKLAIAENSLSNLEVLKKAFSTNGLLAYKIENLVKDLENLANHYLTELSDGRFSLEFVVNNDKLNVQITDNGNVVDILALSSGELARVNTATLIAIRKLMSSISNSRINLLFLDEVINVLDDTGRERLVEVLLKEDLNTYIVSHLWTHPLLEKIEVIKEDNISRLEK